MKGMPESRINDPEEARRIAEAEKHARDQARMPGTTEDNKTYYDEIAVGRGERRKRAIIEGRRDTYKKMTLEGVRDSNNKEITVNDIDVIASVSEFDGKKIYAISIVNPEELQPWGHLEVAEEDIEPIFEAIREYWKENPNARGSAFESIALRVAGQLKNKREGN